MTNEIEALGLEAVALGLKKSIEVITELVEVAKEADRRIEGLEEVVKSWVEFMRGDVD